VQVIFKVLFIFVYLLLRQMAARHTSSNIRSYTEVKNTRNTEITRRKSQVYRHGKWISNQFSDWVVWQFRR